MQGYILENFKAFNGMKKMFPKNRHPFMNCKYNTLLTLAIYFGKNELPILNNVFNTYKFDIDKVQSTDYFKLEVNEFRNKDDLLVSLGINKKTKSIYKDNLFKEIASSLLKGNPISIKIDLFHQHGREFYFHRKHGIHPVIVYGIDFVSEEVFIIDDITEYKEYRVPFAEFYLCCKDLIANNSKFYIEYESASTLQDNSNSLDQNDINKINIEYVNNIISKQFDIESSLEHIQHFSQNYSCVIKNEDILETLSSTIYRKCSQKYKLVTLKQYNTGVLEDLRQNNEIVTTIDQIIYDWSLLRNLTAKAIFSENYNPKVIDKCKELINRIYNKEKEFNNIYYSILNNLK
ncbi:hypothetical protein J7E78_05355 [Paenibacillus polymyxa]|uniref:BtrH N-terminal domain-containing protein n=1 Tax=Paenibacillus polymyxa TaxID=1406 RepID=UPI001BEA2307|nr:BtrH N-terminal domain-containing protein [Paenibacillus polymyxa]MBT2282965.1 hypothetical protein [Paenibacillus polymyxa]